MADKIRAMIKRRAKERVNCQKCLHFYRDLLIPKRTHRTDWLGKRQKSLVALARNANRNQIAWYLNHAHYMGKFQPRD